MGELVKVEKFNSQELSVIEQVVVQGDLAKLNPEQRVLYYRKVCESAGLNPFTRPFDYIQLNGKLTLYAKKDATEQLRKVNGISIEKIESKVLDDLYIVTATARTKDGRTDSATGAVTIGNLKGDAKANAIMKAETKAKRRVTLSISGMGWCDEAEIDTIPSARAIDVDLDTGNIGNVKPLYKTQIDVLSTDQTIEITSLLIQCSQDCQIRFKEYMNKSLSVDIVDDIPKEYYEKIKKNLTKEKDFYQKSLGEVEISNTKLMAES